MSDMESGKKYIANEEFLIKWNSASSNREAADALGLEINSARTRANNLRNILGKDFVVKHPRKSGRVKLKDNESEIERLRAIARQSIVNKN